MDKHNVRLREVRTEDSLDEAKIHEPDTFYFNRMVDKINVAQYDAISEGENMRLIPRVGEVYREDKE